jgi:hypothetical protein
MKWLKTSIIMPGLPIQAEFMVAVDGPRNGPRDEPSGGPDGGIAPIGDWGNLAQNVPRQIAHNSF